VRESTATAAARAQQKAELLHFSHDDGDDDEHGVLLL